MSLVHNTHTLLSTTWQTSHLTDTLDRRTHNSINTLSTLTYSEMAHEVTPEAAGGESEQDSAMSCRFRLGQTFPHTNY